MGNIKFKIYIITDYDIPLNLQMHYLKKLSICKYPDDIAIQIRLKQKEDIITDFTKELKRSLGNIRIILNESISLMKKTNADGVHLKENSNLENINTAEFKKEGKLILKSTHSELSINEAVKHKIDAITYGPVFKTPSKLKYGRPNGYELMKKNKFNIPIFALGGINIDNVKEIKDYFYGFAGIRMFINDDIIKNIETLRSIVWK